jgi:DNA-binding transcriptional LysR family regulator
MQTDHLDGVSTFLAVAEALSFTAAAARQGVTPTAISKAIRALEQRHGVALFQRTTRRVALTEAGNALFLRLRPAAGEIADALAGLGSYRERPMGTLRITASRATGELILGTLVPRFRRAHPDVTLDVSLDDALVDLVASGYDAGIRLGEAVEKDMVAVRLSPEIRWSIVGSPAYFARAGRPRMPEELVRHESLRYRFTGSRAIHRWGFRRGRRAFLVDTPGSVIVDDFRLLHALACDGLGLAYMSDHQTRDAVAQGRLERVLQSFIPVDSGLFLCFPARSQSQLKLKAFIEMARELAAEPAYLAMFRDAEPDGTRPAAARAGSPKAS